MDFLASPKIELFTNSNYAIWSIKIEALLDSRDIFDDVINNPKPTKDDKNGDAFNEWTKKNKQALGIIILSLSSDQAIAYKGIKNAQELWNAIKLRYEGEAEDKSMNLMLELTRLKKKYDESIEGYLTRSQGISRQLIEMGKAITDKKIIRYILEGLPDKYNNVITSILANRNMDFNGMRQNLLDFEKRNPERRQEHVKVYKTSSNQNKVKTCFCCGKTGHFQKDCWFKNRNKVEHQKTKQFPTKRFTKNHEEKANITKEHIPNKDKQEFALTAGIEQRKMVNEWQLDSACTSHMSCDNSWMINEKDEVRQVNLAETGRSINSISRGDIKAVTELDDGQHNNFKLEDVLFVPQLNGNLMSVPSLVKRGNSVTLNQEGAFIYTPDGQLICKGEFEEDMFTISLIHELRQDDSNEKCFKIDKDSRILWHKRLGHINDDYMSRMKRDGMVRGLLDLRGEVGICQACITGKMPRTPFQATYDETAKASNKLKDLINSMENELDKKVKRIRTGNGFEFINRSLEEYFKTKGIKHEKTCNYSPRSNGIAERANRTLLDKARTLLSDGGLPVQFWAEAISTAEYLHNITPNKTQNQETPMELWNGQKPTVKHLKVFGCLAFYKVNANQRHKLQPKAAKGIFIGYSRERKAYRIYDANQCRLHETRDVKFDESKKGIEESHGCIEPLTDNLDYLPLDFQITDSPEMTFAPQHFEGDNSDYPNEENLIINQGEETGSLPEETPPDNRRPVRERKMPIKYNDHIVYQAHEEEIPKNYEETLNSNDKDLWYQAMLDELNSMRVHNVWKIVDRPKYQNIIKSNWVYFIKDTPDNVEPTYKARLVAAGYNQKQGLDYDESFSPVMKMGTFRTLLSLATINKYKIRIFDIKTAYLNGTMERPIYMEMPPGFTEKDKVLLVNKSIYGLPQSGRCWNQIFDEILKNINLKIGEYIGIEKQRRFQQFNEELEQYANQIDNIIKFLINRSNLLDDLFKICEIHKYYFLIHPDIIVSFNGEEGYDNGGLKTELFNLAFEQIFDPNFDMFVYNEELHHYWFKSTSTKSLEYFRNVGMLISLAIFNHVPLNIPFPKVLYRKLAGGVGCFSDLWDFDPTIARNLTQVLDNKSDNVGEDMGITWEKEESEIPITQANKKAYVEDMADDILNRSISEKFDSFKSGFLIINEVGEQLYFIFRPCELEDIFRNDDYDIEKLMSMVEYNEGYSNNSRVIKIFWEVMNELGEEFLKSLLKYIGIEKQRRFQQFNEELEQYANQIDTIIKFLINRSNLLDDLFKICKMHKYYFLIHPDIIVSFNGEEGYDNGGLKTELFNLAFEQIFDPNFDMFVYNEELHHYWFKSTSTKSLEYFRNVGMLISLAIFNRVPLNIPFPKVLYRKLAGGVGCFSDLWDFDPTIARNLTQVLDNKSVNVGEDMGITWVKEESEIPITQANKKAYVEDMADDILNRRISEKFKSFQSGFLLINEVGKQLFFIYRPCELEDIFRNDDYDIEKLMSMVEYNEGYIGIENQRRFQQLNAELEVLANRLDRIIYFSIKRSNLLHDLFKNCGIYKTFFPKHSDLIVIFENEEGYDDGGLKTELFNLAFEQIFDSKFDMFVYNEEMHYYWFKSPSNKSLEYFRNVGMIISLAIYHRVPLNIPFPKVLYRKLAGGVGCFSDLWDFDPTIARNLTQVLDNKSDNVGEDMGITWEKEESEIPITQANKKAYVEDMADDILNRSISEKFDSFKSGFLIINEVGEQLYFIFRPCELEDIFRNDDYDIKKLMSMVEYNEGYSNNSRVIKIFWEVMNELGEEFLKSLLKFVTG
ncbi:hypothetical protein LAZ67_11000678, partial [Cordylochernes scorpioides]